MRVLITGGAGFIGAHLIDHILKTTDWVIICIDKLSYASKGWNRLIASGCYDSPNLKCLTWNLELPFSQQIQEQIGNINIIIHMAADTHVDKSIVNPVTVISNNIMSTVYLLEYARTLKDLKIFVNFSTDEIYGDAPKGISYKEWDRQNPSSPYSASKAAAENICLAYQNTYKIPLIITNLMNAYGIMQHSEKFIPLIIKKLLNNEIIDIHCHDDGVTPGSRSYVHVYDIVSAVMFILDNVKNQTKINIAGVREVDNLELAHKISKLMNVELKYQLTHSPPNRPGHDNRYSLDDTILREMGWQVQMNFDEEIEKIVKWTLDHPEWLDD